MCACGPKLPGSLQAWTLDPRSQFPLSQGQESRGGALECPQGSIWAINTIVRCGLSIDSSSWRICFCCGLPRSPAGPWDRRELFSEAELQMFWILNALDSQATWEDPIFHNSASISLPYHILPTQSQCEAPQCPPFSIPALVLLHVNIDSAPKMANSIQSRIICWPACLALLYSLRLENTSFSQYTVGNSSGDIHKMTRNDLRCRTVGVCLKSPHAQWKPTAGKLGFSWHKGTKFNNFGLLKKVLHFSLHLMSKACSGCLILGQTISLVGQARDKLRDSLISQPSYNI